MGGKRVVEAGVLGLLALTAAGEGIRIVTRHASHLRSLEAGGYLVLLGGLLAALTVLYVLQEPADRWERSAGGGRVLAALGVLVGYVLVLPLLGYLASTFLALVVYLRAFGAYRWGAVLALGGGLALASAWLWASLAIVLPQGLLPWP